MADPEKAFLEFEDGEKLDCVFNPDSITISRGNNWDGPPMPGKGVLRQEYKGATAGTLGLELDFDTTTDGSPVTKYTDVLLAHMEIDESLPGTDDTSSNARPPTVTFHWGQHLHSNPCVITSVTVNYTYFSSSGIPLRAHVSLALKEYSEDGGVPEPQNPTSGTPRPHRTHRVQPGETLDRITARYYGKSTNWRLLATANGIEDPLALRPGSVITVPRMEST
jgi:LysM repeat protein